MTLFELLISCCELVPPEKDLLGYNEILPDWEQE